MKDLLKKTGWSNILVSLIFCVLGIVLIAQPDAAVKVITTTLGVVFIIVGAIKIVEYFASKEHNEIISYDLIYGIIAVVIGLITMLYSNAVEFMFRLMLGIWIIYSGALRLSLAVKLKNINSSAWIYSLIIAIIIIIGGIAVAFTQGAVIVAIGVITLIYAILDFIESIIFLKNVNKIL